jgi:hypothetical protein
MKRTIPQLEFSHLSLILYRIKTDSVQKNAKHRFANRHIHSLSLALITNHIFLKYCIILSLEG